jgi:hypothetical protein
MPEAAFAPTYVHHPGEDPTRIPIDVAPPAGWMTLGELGHTMEPPASFAEVSAAIRELSAEQRARAASFPAANGEIRREPDITVAALDPERVQTRSFVNPLYYGAITARVAERSGRLQ